MNAGVVRQMESQKPAIKARWAALLRASPRPPPVAAALVTPEMLVFMIEDSLVRLRGRLESSSVHTGMRDDLNAFTAIRDGSQCGLHLLLSYYLAGARALRENLAGAADAEKEAVLESFHSLAGEEMATLCQGCRRVGESTCGLAPGFTLPSRPAKPEAPPANGPGFAP